MDYVAAELVIGLMSGLVTFLVTHGVMKQKLDQVMDTQRYHSSKIDDIKEQYVTLNQFNQTIAIIREDQHEIRNDLKKVLEILSSK